jgi:hypothetical protein
VHHIATLPPITKDIVIVSEPLAYKTNTLCFCIFSPVTHVVFSRVLHKVVLAQSITSILSICRHNFGFRGKDASLLNRV